MISLNWTWLLFSQCWQIAILALAVWIIVKYFANDRPHLAHALWLLVLIKCITPPVFSSPTSPFSWLAAQTQNEPAQIAPLDSLPLSLTAAQPKAPGIEPIVVHLSPAHAPPLQPQIDRFSAPKTDTQIGQHVDRSRLQNWRLILERGIIWGWLLGTILTLSITAIRLQRFLSLAKSNRVETNPHLLNQIQSLSQRLGVKRKVRVWLVHHSIGPAVVGIFRATLILPAAMIHEKDDRQLEALLAHELVHIRRGDLVWAFLQTVSTCLFWFHPLVWLASCQVTRESERSCDEETIASLGCKPAAYARTLLSILEHKQQMRVAPALPGVRPVDITSARLERVMKLKNGMNRRTPLWVWLTLFSCGIVVLPGAALVWAQDLERLPPAPADDSKKLKTLNEPAPQEKTPANSNPTDWLAPQPQNVEYQNSAEQPGWAVKSYDVTRLLAKIQKDEQVDREAAKQTILDWLPNRKAPQGYSAKLKLSERVKPIVLGGRNSTFVFAEKQGSEGASTPTTLYVFGDSLIQTLTQNCLSILSTHGVKQIVIETRMLSFKPELLPVLDIAWSISESQSSELIEAVLVQPGEMGLQSKNLLGKTPEQPEWNATFGPTKGKVASASVVEKSSPVLYAIEGKSTLRDLVQKAKSNAGFVLQQAPTITMFDGQQAVVKDSVSRPFVVGMNYVDGFSQGKPALLQEPVIRTIDEGTSIEFAATISEDSNVKLVSDLAISNIRSVKNFEFKHAKPGSKSGEDSQAKLQIPEVAITGVRSINEIPADQSLLLCCQRENAEMETECLIIMLTCTIIEGDTLEMGHQNASQSHVIEATLPRLQSPSATGSLTFTNPPVFQPGYNQAFTPINFQQLPNAQLPYVLPVLPQRQVPLMIRGSLKEANYDEYRQMEDALAELGHQVEFGGKVKFETSGSTIRLSGEDFEFSNQATSYSDLLRIRGKKGEIRFDSDKHQIQFHFSGQTKLDYEGATMEADQIRLTLGSHENFDLTGNARLFFDEARIAADQISLDDNGMILIMTGNVEMVRGKQGVGESTHMGDRIVWNIADQQISVDGQLEWRGAKPHPGPTQYYLKDDLQYFPQGPNFKLQPGPTALPNHGN